MEIFKLFLIGLILTSFNFPSWVNADDDLGEYNDPNITNARISEPGQGDSSKQSDACLTYGRCPNNPKDDTKSDDMQQCKQEIAAMDEIIKRCEVVVKETNKFCKDQKSKLERAASEKNQSEDGQPQLMLAANGGPAFQNSSRATEFVNLEQFKKVNEAAISKCEELVKICKDDCYEQESKSTNVALDIIDSNGGKCAGNKTLQQDKFIDGYLNKAGACSVELNDYKKRYKTQLAANEKTAKENRDRVSGAGEKEPGIDGATDGTPTNKPGGTASAKATPDESPSGKPSGGSGNGKGSDGGGDNAKKDDKKKEKDPMEQAMQAAMGALPALMNAMNGGGAQSPTQLAQPTPMPGMCEPGGAMFGSRECNSGGAQLASVQPFRDQLAGTGGAQLVNASTGPDVAPNFGDSNQIRVEPQKATDQKGSTSGGGAYAGGGGGLGGGGARPNADTPARRGGGGSSLSADIYSGLRGGGGGATTASLSGARGFGSTSPRESAGPSERPQQNSLQDDINSFRPNPQLIQAKMGGNDVDRSIATDGAWCGSSNETVIGCHSNKNTFLFHTISPTVERLHDSLIKPTDEI